MTRLITRNPHPSRQSGPILPPDPHEEWVLQELRRKRERKTILSAGFSHD